MMAMYRETTTMRASGWKGGTYGIRVGRENANKYFPKNWTEFFVEFDGRAHRYALKSTFWTTCPEFRGAEIGTWLRQNRLAPWPHGKPPSVELTPWGSNRFGLSI
jgi:hypothetical protein